MTLNIDWLLHSQATQAEKYTHFLESIELFIPEELRPIYLELLDVWRTGVKTDLAQIKKALEQYIPHRSWNIPKENELGNMAHCLSYLTLSEDELVINDMTPSDMISFALINIRTALP